MNHRVISFEDYVDTRNRNSLPERLRDCEGIGFFETNDGFCIARELGPYGDKSKILALYRKNKNSSWDLRLDVGVRCKPFDISDHNYQYDGFLFMSGFKYFPMVGQVAYSYCYYLPVAKLTHNDDLSVCYNMFDDDGFGKMLHLIRDFVIPYGVPIQNLSKFFYLDSDMIYETRPLGSISNNPRFNL